MAIQNITYDNKVALNQNADIPDVNKVTDSDMNEIKSVVNNNATELTNLPGTIVESDSNANGTYVKFSDGTMICYKNISLNININKEWGNVYENTTAANLGSWAATFTATPSMGVLTIGGAGIWVQTINNASTTSCGSAFFVSATSGTKNTMFSIIGIGRWK